MKLSVAKIRGLGFVLWHARHEFYHVLLGLMWAWILREVWKEFNIRWVLLSAFGAVLPDAEHLLYFFSYGKKDNYTQDIASMLKKHEWRALTVFIEHGHKYNTDLEYHNVYTIGILFILAIIASLFDWHAWVVLMGAMVTHYLFDIADDIVTLGYINPNWKRWGNGRKKKRAS